jgi:hypothetical protein
MRDLFISTITILLFLLVIYWQERNRLKYSMFKTDCNLQVLSEQYLNLNTIYKFCSVQCLRIKQRNCPSVLMAAGT